MLPSVKDNMLCYKSVSLDLYLQPRSFWALTAKPESAACCHASNDRASRAAGGREERRGTDDCLMRQQQMVRMTRLKDWREANILHKGICDEWDAMHLSA